jgi:type IV fimbrial biogenesis protein FimT
MRNDAGFSFAELMVVIALVGVLSAIAVPNLLRNLPERHLRGAARNLYADMQKARLLALKENRKMQVRFETDVSPGYYYFDSNGNSKWDSIEFRRNLSDYGGGAVDYGKGKAVKKWDGNAIGVNVATNISFMPTGTANLGTTYLHNQNKDTCYAVTTTNFGHVKIRKFNGTSWEK